MKSLVDPDGHCWEVVRRQSCVLEENNNIDYAQKQLGITRDPSGNDARFIAIVYRVKIKANKIVDILVHLIYEGSSESRVLALFNTT